MGLVIKSKGVTAPEGSEKLYRDALVSEGTLLLQDFSNRGTLHDFRLQNGDPVFDLSRDVSLGLGIENQASFKHNLEDENPELTLGKGFRLDNLGPNPGGAENLGIDLGMSLLDYLSTKTGNILLVAWLRVDPSATFAAGRFVTSTGDGGGNGFPIAFNITTGGAMTISFAGASGVVGSAALSDGKLVQAGIEYMGEGIPHNVYINSELSGTGNNPAATFGIPDSTLLLGKSDTGNRPSIMYRWLIEDLDASGRTAEEVVRKDWDYCNGFGEFVDKPTKRPFIDVV